MMLDLYQFQNNKNRTWWKTCASGSVVRNPKKRICRIEIARSRGGDDDFVNAINTRQLDRMSVVGGGQVKPVLLGYARAFWPPRLAPSPQRRPPSPLFVVPRIFIEPAYGCYFRRRTDVPRSSSSRSRTRYHLPSDYDSRNSLNSWKYTSRAAYFVHARSFACFQGQLLQSPPIIPSFARKNISKEYLRGRRWYRWGAEVIFIPKHFHFDTSFSSLFGK